MRLVILFFLIYFLSACSDSSDSVDDIQPSSQAQKILALEASADANRLFDEIFESLLKRSPESQTYLGYKEGKDRWDDLSDSYAQETKELEQSWLVKLEQLNTSNLDAQTLLSYQLLVQQLKNSIADFKWRHHDYAVNQMFGVHSAIPSLLINAHTVGDEADALAYISRLNAVPMKIDQLLLSMDKQKELGISLPAFVFPLVIDDSRNVISGAPFDNDDDSAIWADFKKKTASFANAEKLQQQAKQALLEKFRPAYIELIAYLQELESQTKSSNGVWALPEGKEYYSVKLTRTTTTALTADEIHQIGLDNVDRIHAEMKGIKKAVGFNGDLADFFEFMRTDSQFYFSDDERGRKAYLEANQAYIDVMSSRLDELFITKPLAELEVKPVEAFREKSAGKAFYQRPAPDGSRPGRYYVNLYNMKDVSKYQMEALAYHEALPGHHMQIAIAQELKGIPKFRKFGGYTAYIEGWGLYSERIPKEMGLYEDPYSDFGRLAMELWRATRLVVDTGLHSKKWSREQAINYLVENTPNSERDCRRAIERYMVMPSQATAYYVGMREILTLRAEAKQSLGERFDIREFHDVILAQGALPLSVLREQVYEWLEFNRLPQ
ncbi:DUF885 family protein [Agaribacterium sp. ZY112]|uniref:DUF885 domain-containing protein n=1 Tax=Agaribacterium sp. ZY112 TaxID=3233574 RepID=UPI00352678A1